MTEQTPPRQVADAAGRRGKAEMLTPLDAIEISLRRLRVAAIAFLCLAEALSRSSTGGATLSWSVTAALCVLLLVANFASRRLQYRESNIRALVATQLVIDVAVTCAFIVSNDPAPNSIGWVIVGFPVLEGALRYRTVGAVTTWVAIAAVLGGNAFIGWTAIEGFTPFLDMGRALSLGLVLGVPAGYLADNLAMELVTVGNERQLAQKRSRLLGVLAVAGQDFTTHDRSALARTSVYAARELGFSHVDIGMYTPSSAHFETIFTEQQAPSPSTALDHTASTHDVGCTVVNGTATATVGSIAAFDDAVVLLRAQLEPNDPGASERLQAFEMLTKNASIAMSAAIRHEELTAAQRRLEFDATHDQLTGLLNRAGLLGAMSSAFAPEDGFQPEVGVVFLDLDGFKGVNDTLGHDAGDTVLQVIGNRLLSFLPSDAVVSRLGGDEFVLLLHNASPRKIAALSFELKALIEQRIDTAAGPASVGASIGSSMVTDPSMTPEDALKTADSAMYADKSNKTSRGRQPLVADEPAQNTSPRP